MLCFDEQGLAYLKVVDGKGKEVETDYRLYTDSNFTILRSLQRAREELQEKIAWGAEQERVYLHEYRWLLYELMRCDNIVDSNMQPIGVSDEVLQVRLVVQHVKNGYATHADVMGEGMSSE